MPVSGTVLRANAPILQGVRAVCHLVKNRRFLVSARCLSRSLAGPVFGYFMRLRAATPGHVSPSVTLRQPRVSVRAHSDWQSSSNFSLAMHWVTPNPAGHSLPAPVRQQRYTRVGLPHFGPLLAAEQASLL